MKLNPNLFIYQISNFFQKTLYILNKIWSSIVPNTFLLRYRYKFQQEPGDFNS